MYISALIFFAALLLTLFPISTLNLKVWFNKSTSNTELIDNLLTGAIVDNNVEQVPCTQIKVNQVWSKTFTRLNSETPVRKADLNGDGVRMKLEFKLGIFINYFHLDSRHNNWIWNR